VKRQPLFPVVDGHWRMEREPRVRIGVVLAEDDKPEVKLTLPGREYEVLVGAEAQRVATLSDKALTAKATAQEVLLEDAGGESICGPASLLTLAPLSETPPRFPAQGIRVRGIVAGRGFHWQKEIDQTLTGALEFRAERGRLVMVNHLPLEEYLIGVITGEMSGQCPAEFMKAQAVAARSWLLATPYPTHPEAPFDWCNDDHCQRYQGSEGWSEQAVQAISDCRGEALITKSGQYCDARYSKSCGGISEDSASVWGTPLEGLQSVIDAPKGSQAARFFPANESDLKEYFTGSWLQRTDIYCSPGVVPEETIGRYLGRVDEKGTYFRWRKTLTQEALQQSLAERGGIEDLAEVLDLRPGRRGRSGRLERLEVEYRTRGGTKKTHWIEREYHIRAALSMQFLYSSAFLLDCNRDKAGKLLNVSLVGGGWGHGAGLCQIGALGMALQRHSYQEILLHYYQGVRLERVYS